MNIDKTKYYLVLLVAALVTGLDQLTKVIVCKTIPLYGRIEVLADFFNLIHIRNSGIAFGLFKQFGSQFKVLSLICISLVSLIVIGYLITQIKQNDRLQTAGLALILGGAIGNLIDRFRLGEVIDFLDVHWQNAYHWPAFNVADSAITVGIVIMIYCELFKGRHHHEHAHTSDKPHKSEPKQSTPQS
ncbi:MAG: signal peptidase II [Deltaproteobacteria bacterium]|nr:signal peptidase II [Deltaproteobacteria bacterium]